MKNIFHPLRSAFRKERRATPPAPLAGRARAIWMLGNVLMLVGVVLLLYVGAQYATDAYGRYAARGDTDLAAPLDVALPDEAQSEPAPFIAAQPTTRPPATAAPAVAAPSAGQVVSAPPPTAVPHRATVTRLVIPSVAIDAKVIEVGWEQVTQNGVTAAVWQVAKYAVGQHRGSANPGEGGNIVLSGHVGGYGLVFRDLFYVRPGEPVTLYSNGQQYHYIVKQRLIVNEEGVSAAQQAANAQLIAPTDHELVTLVTCWPATGADKFTQRVVVQAVPVVSSTAPGATPATPH